MKFKVGDKVAWWSQLTRGKKIAITAGCVTAAIALVFALTALSLNHKAFWAPKFQNVEREVFESTKSYNKGKIQELVKYFDEYRRTEDEGDKKALRAIVAVSFADFDVDKIQEPALRAWVRNCRGY